ncbi:MAG: NADH:ubiquinone reductase (Na(+)-transporting) subunit C [Chlamydiales bacterium]|nr:NADH:ubiquinone reductase (Na(+)-transporting) subunit C [Chlamydiales bacterium]
MSLRRCLTIIVCAAIEGGIVSQAKKHTDFQTIIFIIILCVVCGFLLAIVAYSLRNPQAEAREFDRSKQMLIAAKVLDHEGFFTLLDKEGKTQRARFESDKLVADAKALKATDDQIKEISKLRIRPMLTDAKGESFTLKDKDLDIAEYLEKNKKAGYANLPLKLYYIVAPNGEEKGVYAYVIPISGFGLWAPIYGYIALEPNADTVISTTWYEMGETPGLGANITEAWWQNQFFGKAIFHQGAGGKTDFKTADIGIVVVKGKVVDVYGTSPKAESAVDGISGATLTGDGVTAAYQDSLTPYRAFLMKAHENAGKAEE